jgi:multiple sugar transport system substrate-binding protein
MQSRFRQFSLALLAIVVLGLLFWNPGARSPPRDGKTHVRYWLIVGADEGNRYSIRKFNRMQDEIVVDPTPIPWQEHEKKILTAVLSGDPPDVVSQFAPVVKWASRMALRPLDDFIEQSDLDTSVFFPALMNEMKWQGRTFALPIYTASYAFFYNKDHFREVGLDPDRPPKDWDEVASFAQRLNKYDDDGRMLRAGFLPTFSPAHAGILGNAAAAQLIAWQLGAQYISDDGKTISLATPPVIRSFTWTRDYYDDYDFDQVQAFIGGLGQGEQNGFLTGKLSMLVLDMGFLDQLRRYRPELNYGVVQTPSFEGFPTASISGSWWLGIPRGAKHPEAAWKFIEYYVNAQTLLEELAQRDDDLFPANRLAATDPLFLKDADTRVFVRQMEFSHSPVVVPLAHGVFWREFYGALERSVFKTQSVSEALKQAETIIQDANTRAVDYDEFVRSKMSFGG